MNKRLTESNFSECQTKFNLRYHVPFAYWCQELVGFEGKDVLEVGGSLPKEFVLDYLHVKSWSAIETPDYDLALQEVGGSHHPSTIRNRNNSSQNMTFYNRKLGKYNLFLENIENLPSDYYEKFDLIFSIAAFEHIQKFPAALDKMFLALKPSGKLFSIFSPIWSAINGHHLPKITDRQGRVFDYHDSPIPPWGHLLMRPSELCNSLYQVTDKSTANLITYYVYNSPQINRFFTEDYIDFFGNSSFYIEQLELIFADKISKNIQEKLQWLYPGRKHFANNGILAILDKHKDKSKEKYFFSKVAKKSERILKNSSPLGIHELIEQYQTKNLDQSIEDQIRQLRRQIADFWINTAEAQLENVYVSDIGKAHQFLQFNSGLKYEKLNEAETIFVDELRAKNCQGFDEPLLLQSLLAATLYCRADQLPLPFGISAIPQWFLSDYLKFILSSPSLFQEIGEVNLYYQYMQGLVDFLHKNILENKESELWQNVALLFAQYTNFIPLYFTNDNLRDIYTKRSDIIEFALTALGYQIDYVFPKRAANREKIHIGVLVAQFTPQTQNFATIPAFEYLDRDKFEIILYVLQKTDHPLEQYCKSRVDKLVELSGDLSNQVQTIRADDLDILLIGTNVTAVTYAITLLALHRLARLQFTMIRSPVTTGMVNVDYYISGKLSEPSLAAQQQYREQLVTLEGTGLCFNYSITPLTSTVQPDRVSLGLSDKHIVFMSGANFYKIIPELRETWAKIIAAVPNSVLVLYPFSPSWSNSYPTLHFLKRMKTIFANHDIEENRLIVLDTLPNRADVKEYLRLGDVYLDAYPHSGSHSIIDALEVGLPPITLDGNSVRSKHGAALLQELQIDDLIVNTEESYVELAIALGMNSDLRKQKSDQIKQRMQENPRFFDSQDYSAQIGALFQKLFQKYQVDSLVDNFRLRDINLIIFPDWNQAEDILYQNLASVIRAVVAHPDNNKMTLLVDTSDISEEDADLALSSVVMNLLMEEELDVTEEAEISLVGKLSAIEWEALLSYVHTRIIWESENQQAIARLGLENMQGCELHSFSDKRAVQLDNGLWNLI